MDTSQKQDQRTAAKRHRGELLEAADRVVLRDGPEASIKPIPYRHFGDKSGLYRALAKRHTKALLATFRAALDSPNDRYDRVEATLHAYLAAIEARPQVHRFLMHPAEGTTDGEKGFDIGRHSAPLLRRMGEEPADVLAERLDLGPPSQELARAWGHGIVGMMHAAGDWWLGERPRSRDQLVRQLTDLLWGGLTTVDDRVGSAGW